MRNIQTHYFRKQKCIKINYSNDANLAVANAVRHMQVNHYGAHVCQVVDGESGIVHAELKRSVAGSISITYRRDPTQFETKIRFDIFFHSEEKG
jgi:hypothetical protein